MHIHILGICGTFMGGIAALAKHAGHTVTGCDEHVYPPMSSQLEKLGITLTEGFNTRQLKDIHDVYLVGNVVSRGNRLIEEILRRGLPYTSGPQWLFDNILRGRWVVGVSGTHGKTTVSSLLAYIMDQAGLNPGFLIGGVPNDFPFSARLTDSNFFVIEADEYDTAFFDKRSKFVHYSPKTLIINNLEFDHADIFPDLAAIEKQFHHLVRTVPSNGLIIANKLEKSVSRVLSKGSWTPVEWFNHSDSWITKNGQLAGEVMVLHEREFRGRLRLRQAGKHHESNALAAIIASRHLGISVETSIEAIQSFKGVKRRMELLGVVSGVEVYLDFAHHPTAVRCTLDGLRAAVGEARIIVLFEPRSNTMKMGFHKDSLAESFQDANLVYCFSNNLDWDLPLSLKPLGDRQKCFSDLDRLVNEVSAEAQFGDRIIVMSNGDFGNVASRLLEIL